MNKTKGTVYWITGLSGAGKTTIGQRLFKKIHAKKSNIVLLDGDVLRTVFKSTDYTQDGRKKLGFQYSALCKMLSDQGIDVIICTIAMYDDIRTWNRGNITNYQEIYLKVDIEELIRRDQKGLYTKALRNEIQNVMGINLEYEEPKHPDMVFDNSGSSTPEEIVEQILAVIQNEEN